MGIECAPVAVIARAERGGTAFSQPRVHNRLGATSPEPGAAGPAPETGAA